MKKLKISAKPGGEPEWVLIVDDLKDPDGVDRVKLVAPDGVESRHLLKGGIAQLSKILEDEELRYRARHPDHSSAA